MFKNIHFYNRIFGIWKTV